MVGVDFRGVTEEDSGRQYAEGAVPLLSVEGTSRECGEQLGRTWRESIARIRAEGPSYGQFNQWWLDKAAIGRVVDRIAPHLREILVGMMESADIADTPLHSHIRCRKNDGCTSFSVNPALTRDGKPLSGQNKDTPMNRLFEFCVLRIKPTDGAGFLTVTYPGEIAGYGLSSTGMSAFRNSLYVAPASTRGLPFDLFVLLALLVGGVEKAVEIAKEYGIVGCGSVLLTDKSGNSVAVEFGAGKICDVKPKEGILVHANHPDADEMKLFEEYTSLEREGSHRRQLRLREELVAESDRLSVAGIFHALSDHAGYPLSLCRHPGKPTKGFEGGMATTISIVCDNVAPRLFVTRGQPCMNFPVEYSY